MFVEKPSREHRLQISLLLWHQLGLFGAFGPFLLLIYCIDTVAGWEWSATACQSDDRLCINVHRDTCRFVEHAKTRSEQRIVEAAREYKWVCHVAGALDLDLRKSASAIYNALFNLNLAKICIVLHIRPTKYTECLRPACVLCVSYNFQRINGRELLRNAFRCHNTPRIRVARLINASQQLKSARGNGGGGKQTHS